MQFNEFDLSRDPTRTSRLSRSDRKLGRPKGARDKAPRRRPLRDDSHEIKSKPPRRSRSADSPDSEQVSESIGRSPCVEPITGTDDSDHDSDSDFGSSSPDSAETPQALQLPGPSGWGPGEGESWVLWSVDSNQSFHELDEDLDLRDRDSIMMMEG